MSAIRRFVALALALIGVFAAGCSESTVRQTYEITPQRADSQKQISATKKTSPVIVHYIYKDGQWHLIAIIDGDSSAENRQ